MSYAANVGFGKETSRYYADFSDILGLDVKTETFEEFVEIVFAAVSDLLGSATSGSKIDFHQQVVRAA